jgi:hypothetical protein
MPRLYRVGPEATQDSLDLGRRLYRLFLLSILFGVIWVKGYLWSAFVIALVLYLFDVVVIPARATETIEIPDVEPPSRRERSRWKWRPEDPS